jgi:hypothetical protein
MPRKSIAHDHIRIHDQENYVEGHRSAAEHIKSVFDRLLCNSDCVTPDAELYIVAIEGGAENTLEVFKKDCKCYCHTSCVLHNSPTQLKSTAVV